MTGKFIMQKVISVCMAVHNGEKFISQQLVSIISDLQETRLSYEIVIVDDSSIDGTTDVIHGFNNPDIRLFYNKKNLGHVKAFERALANSCGQFIFLSDQDDVWLPGRARKMLEALTRKNDLILFSEFEYITSEGEFIVGSRSKLHMYKSSFNNLIRIMLGKANYWGCACVFDRKLLKTALPFYYGLESHDLWLAINGSLAEKIGHYGESTLLHRLHSLNVTPKSKRSLYKIVRTRLLFLYGCCLFCFRILKLRISWNRSNARI